MIKIKPILFTVIQFLTSLLLMIVCLIIAKATTHFFEINFPSALIAMLLLFLLLSIGVIKAAWIAPASQPVLKYMALFFIPAGVGLVEHLNIIAMHWPLLMSTLILVPSFGLFFVSYIAKRRGSNG
ncbi:CidA/LrgA family protein [Pseudoalteromonas phenolica]|uniref:CidA/LrgA family protein n=1 Tax=Pseudoalteromonas phenolica TaxID=161398 RepID=A0A4Q7ILW8_9GAMM|nr:CidA/LrgA family protein [Pseudoalteromonas phenolica]RZQ53263.1 CidA/LrgA family protein [Pseudoalteromonas phenolica]